MKFLKYTLVITFFVFPFIGNAQLTHLDNLDLNISPSNPKAHQVVTVSADLFSFNPNLSYFTWYIDGTVTKEGIGEDEVKFQTGKANTKNTITLVIKTENNSILEEQIIIQPTEVTLLWEAQTGTPMFYKGKALHTAGSEIKFVTIPNLYQNGRKVSSKNLVYTWEKNGKILGSLSGIGESSITLENDKLLRDIKVSVLVETADKLISGKDTLSISVGKPEILFYKDDPLLGRRYDNSIGSDFNLNDNEITIISEPFFFSSKSLSYSWKIDGKTIDNKKSFILLNNLKEGKGKANVSVVVKDTVKLLQSVKNSFNIEFGTPLLESLFNF